MSDATAGSRAERPIAVLFDLDGTLIDSVGLLLACVHHAFADFSGRRPTSEEWIAGIGTPLAQQIAAYASDPVTVAALTSRYRAFQREQHDAQTTVFPGTLETLATLADRGHPMGIVTSKSDEMMRRGIEHTGIARFMSVTVGADACTRHKPDPFPVRLALDRLGYRPDEAVFVGDSPHDVNAGNAAGVVTIAALWGPFTRQQLAVSAPTHFLDQIGALPPLVERIQSRIRSRAAV